MALAMTPWSLGKSKEQLGFLYGCREQILPRLSGNIQDQDDPYRPYR
jgi:hypothetical protein